MKLIKDIIGKKARAKWRVASKSKTGVFYNVMLFGTGYYKCDCFASRSGKICSHIQMIKYNENTI